MLNYDYRTHALIGIATCALAGCGAIPFDVEQNIPEQRVAGNPNPLAMLFPTFLQVPITVDITSETQKRWPASSLPKPLTRCRAHRSEPTSRSPSSSSASPARARRSSSKSSRVIRRSEPVASCRSDASFVSSPSI